MVDNYYNIPKNAPSINVARYGAQSKREKNFSVELCVISKSSRRVIQKGHRATQSNISANQRHTRSFKLQRIHLGHDARQQDGRIGRMGCMGWIENVELTCGQRELTGGVIALCNQQPDSFCSYFRVVRKRI
jgi:hypothetical protein